MCVVLDALEREMDLNCHRVRRSLLCYNKTNAHSSYLSSKVLVRLPVENYSVQTNMVARGSRVEEYLCLRQ